jgi:hypothetical protein
MGREGSDICYDRKAHRRSLGFAPTARRDRRDDKV